MNYPQLKRELLIALRGKRTQGQVVQKLGLTYNQVYRWEVGATKLLWTDFVLFCEACRVPLAEAFQKCFSYKSSLSDYAKIIKHFGTKSTQTQVAKALGVSRYTFSRWLHGKTCPTFEQVLALIDYGSAEFFLFIESLANPKDLPSVRDSIQQIQEQRQVIESHPWLSAVLSALDLQAIAEIKYSAEWMQKKAKLSRPIVHRTVEELKKAQLIEKKNNTYVPSLEKFSAVKGISRQGRQKLVQFWNQRILDYIATSFDSKQSRNSFKVFTLRAQDYAKILERYTEFFNDVASIINSSQNKADKIYLFTMNLIDFEDLPEADPK